MARRKQLKVRKKGPVFVMALLQGILLLTTDPARGVVGWEKELSSSRVSAIESAGDGGFVVVGTKSKKNATPLDLDVSLIRIDSQGEILWEKEFDYLNGWDNGWNVQLTSDGGFIVVGDSYDHIEPRRGYLIKTDAQGERVWERRISYVDENLETFSVWLRSVQQTGDGGYIVTGWTDARGKDMFLAKRDAAGRHVWAATYNAWEIDEPPTWFSNDRAYGVLQAADGGYVMVGRTDAFNPIYPMGCDVYLVKVDTQGIVAWERTFHFRRSEDRYDQDNFEGFALRETNDGGFVIVGGAGSIEDPGRGDEYAYLIRTDAEGHKIWSRTMPNAGDMEGYGRDVQVTSDGGFIIAAEKAFVTEDWTENPSGWLVKTDGEGNIEWERSYVNAADLLSVRETAGGGFMAVGTGYQGSYLVYHHPGEDPEFTEPLPDIIASGASSSQLTIPETEPLSLSLSLVANDCKGKIAEWWLAAFSEKMRSWFSFDLASGRWMRGLTPAMEATCRNIRQYKIPQTLLPEGAYRFYFGVDLSPNGALDPKNIYYDQTRVNVLPAARNALD